MNTPPPYPPRWCRDGGLDCGSGNPGSIRCIPSPGVGPLMTRRLFKDVFGRSVVRVRVEVGSAHERPLAAHGVGCPAAGLDLETGPSLYYDLPTYCVHLSCALYSISNTLYLYNRTLISIFIHLNFRGLSHDSDWGGGMALFENKYADPGKN